MCSTDVLDLYEEYRQDFEAWGHEFLKAPLSLERFGDLVAEREDIEILDDCGHATEKDLTRRDELDRLMLTHASYFANGPRVLMVYGPDDA